MRRVARRASIAASRACGAARQYHESVVPRASWRRPCRARTRPAAGPCRAPWRRPPSLQIAWRKTPRGQPDDRNGACSTGVKQRWTKRSPNCASACSMRTNVAKVAAEADDHADGRPSPDRSRDPSRALRPWPRAWCESRALQTDEDRFADEEVADVELRRSSGTGREGARRLVVEPMASVTFQAECARQRVAAAVSQAAPTPSPPRVVSPTLERVTPGAGMEFDDRSVQRDGGFECLDRTGSMKSETRVASSPEFADERHQGSSWPPINIETAFRRPLRALSPAPDKRHAARSAGAISSICSVAAISKFSGTDDARACSRAISSSRMCRRSSRKCAVMPSAPACDGQPARPATGSGRAPPRAFRTVATWSMLTPRRKGR